MARPSHTDDGKDVGRDLSGGWYDAGDHWKSNHTMAFAATHLAWSVVQYPEAYQKTGQLDEVFDNIRHITDYFLRCTVDPNLANLADFSRFEVYIDIGNRIGPQPAVHSVWSAPEATGGFTLRESLKLNKDVPGADSASCMAATLAAVPSRSTRTATRRRRPTRSSCCAPRASCSPSRRRFPR
jgi:hypothetical protein